MNVYLFQVYWDTNLPRLPYTVGCLWAFAKESKVITSNYELAELVYQRILFEQLLERMQSKPPAIAGFSSYMWNEQWNLQVSRRLKEEFPECLVVFGGPSAPVDSVPYLRAHPYIDIIVHGEGELTFRDILEVNVQDRDWSRILGIAYLDQVTSPRQRILDLDSLPSPYRTGVFDALIETREQWIATWEGSRGCPYRCTFCDWGSLTYQKTIFRPEGRGMTDLKWLLERPIRMIESTDANFGLNPLDVEYARALVAGKKAYGNLRTVNLTWAKNSTERVFEIAQILRDGDLLSSITLAVQSLHEPTLEAIKRRNMKMGRLSEVLAKCEQFGLANFSQFILGLPLETRESWLRGICSTLEHGQHTAIDSTVLQLLPNSELSTEEARKKWKFRTVWTLMEDTAVEHDQTSERAESVVETSTLTAEDFVDCYVLTKMIIGLHHASGLTQALSRILRNEYGVSYYQFYTALLNWSSRASEKSVLGEIHRTCHAHTLDVTLGKRNRFPLDLVELPSKYLPFGRHSILQEKYVSMAAQLQRDELFAELIDFTNSSWATLDEELWEFCKCFSIMQGERYPMVREFRGNWDEVLQGRPLRQVPRSISFHSSHKALYTDVWDLIRTTPFRGRRRAGVGIARVCGSDVPCLNT